MLLIRLLGEFRLDHNGLLVNSVNTLRLQSLLAYLLMHRNAPQQRQKLAFLLWPDSSEAQARTNLRKLLYQLRQALPDADAYLNLQGQTVQWQEQAEYSVDLVEFEAVIRVAAENPKDEQRNLDLAADLYRGDLLPGCYDEWIEPERERLRQQFTAVLERLISLKEARRAYREALNDAQRLLQMDSLNESAYRHLMRLYALNGDRASALRIYHSCVTTLLSELAVEPGPETHSLYERLLQSETHEPSLTNAVIPSSTGSRRVSPLVGREEEWLSSQGVWQKATEGQPACLMISGVAGIGKTRLAEELLRWINRQGYVTAAARCFAAEGGMVYSPVTEWLRSDALRKYWIGLDNLWLREIARLVPELLAERPDLPMPDPLTENWQRQRLFEALARAVCTARFSSVALLIDDLQWCDSETLSWLHYLLRSTPPNKLLLIGTLRLEELSSAHQLEGWLADLRYAGRLTEIELGSLSAAETGELAAYEAGQVLDEASSARLFAETEGHPLFVVEAVRMASETGRKIGASEKKPVSEGNAYQPSGFLSPTVQVVIANRLAQLSPAARDLAGLAATIGRSFTYSVLARASDEMDVPVLVGSLDELWKRRILREQGTNAYDFSHGKIREAAYNGLSAARRRYLHTKVGEALAGFIAKQEVGAQEMDSGDLSGQIGWHFDQAGLPERAIPYYRQAAERERQIYANEEAVRFYRRALALLAASDTRNAPLAAEIGEQCGDLLLLMTRREEARAAFEEALRHQPASALIGQAQLVCKIGNTWRDEYHFEESLQIYSRALQVLGGPPTREDEQEQAWWQTWIQIQIEILNVYYWLAWIEKSDALMRELRQVIERHGTLRQRASIFQMLGITETRRNRYLPTDENITYFRHALELFSQAGSQENIPSARFGCGFVLFLHGDLDQAEPELIAAMHLAEQHGDLSLLSRCLTYLTILQRKRGDIGQVLALAERAQKTAEAAQMPEYVGAARANLAWIAWRTGDHSLTRAHSQAALNLWNQSPGVQAAATPYYWTANWPLIAVSLVEDKAAQAVEHARDLLQPHRKHLPDDLNTALSGVVAAWESNAEDAVGMRNALSAAVKLAESLHEF